VEEKRRERAWLIENLEDMEEENIVESKE